MNKQAMKEKLCAAIDARRDDIIAIGTKIFEKPELGYKEHYASSLVQQVFADLGLEYRSEIAITGVRAEMKGRESKAKVAVLGELDAVVCPEHPHADPQTGAAHSCGHNVQVAAMLGVAMALKDTGLMAELDGDVAFMAVPAEEFVELEYRNKLRNEGKIKFLGGKQEFIALGEFDDIDVTMMFHSSNSEKKIGIGGTSNGFIGKLIRYIGKEAHAGGAPHLGVNALNAAMLGLMGIHAQRETFRDSDHIRVHPIITKGGDLVNIVPADVRMETYVRGAEMDAIIDASKKVDRALRAGAEAVGAEVEIVQLPGYLPRYNAEALNDIFYQNAVALVGEDEVARGGHGSGSSDIGDVSALMPTIHPYVGGISGRGHASDYAIADPELAYIVPTKLMAMSLVDLLADGAAGVAGCQADFEPVYTKESYLQMWEELLNS
ncbi:MAG: amidohydrolase [Firmicutes bacterium]|nr:amidohydrolase [Bacillota bacterium]